MAFFPHLALPNLKDFTLCKNRRMKNLYCNCIAKLFVSLAFFHGRCVPLLKRSLHVRSKHDFLSDRKYTAINYNFKLAYINNQKFIIGKRQIYKIIFGCPSKKSCSELVWAVVI